MRTAFLLFLFAVSVSTSSLASVETKEFDIDGIKQLKLENTSGNAMIMATTSGKAKVTANKTKFGENCSLEVRRSGDDLVVKVKEKSITSMDECQVHFDIKVPQEVKIDVKTGSGNVSLSGTRGETKFRMGSGDTLIQANVTRLDAMSGSGEVSFTGTLEEGNVRTGSGDVTLTFQETPKKGKLDIKSGSGNATINLPESTQLLSDFKAGSGKLVNELGDTEGAPFRVKMKTGSGNLFLRKLK